MTDEQIKEVFKDVLPKTRKPLDAKTIKQAQALVGNRDDIMERAKRLLGQ